MFAKKSDHFFWTTFDYNSFVSQLTLTQTVFHDYALNLNYPSWSLSVEFVFYLLFPILFYFLRKIHSVHMIAIGIMFWIVTQIFYVVAVDYFQLSFNFKLYSPAFHLSSFVQGICLGLVFVRFRNHLEKFYLLIVLITFTFLIMILCLMFIKSPILKYYHSGMFNFLFIGLILIFSLDVFPFKKIFGNAIFIFLGEISYSIYIFQYAFWVFIFAYGQQWQLTWIYSNFYISLIALIVFSSFFYLLIERPIQAKFKKTDSAVLKHTPS